jgi:hypothetical protein
MKKFYVWLLRYCVAFTSVKRLFLQEKLSVSSPMAALHLVCQQGMSRWPHDISSKNRKRGINAEVLRESLRGANLSSRSGGESRCPPWPETTITLFRNGSAYDARSIMPWALLASLPESSPGRTFGINDLCGRHLQRPPVAPLVAQRGVDDVCPEVPERR